MSITSFSHLGKLADPLPPDVLARIRPTFIPDPNGLDQPTETQAKYRMTDFEDNTLKSFSCMANRAGEFVRDIEPSVREPNTSSFLDDDTSPEAKKARKLANRRRREYQRTGRMPRAGKGGAPRSLPVGTAKVQSNNLYYADINGVLRKLALWPIDPDLVDRALRSTDVPHTTIVEIVRGVRQSINRIVKKRYKVSAKAGPGKWGQVFMGIADDCFQAAYTNVHGNKVPSFDHEKMRHIARNTARDVIRKATQAGKCPMPYVHISETLEDVPAGQATAKGDRFVGTVTRFLGKPAMQVVERGKKRTKGFYKPKAMTTSAGDTLGEYVPASGMEEREAIRRMMEQLTDDERGILVDISRRGVKAAMNEPNTGPNKVYKLLDRAKALLGRRR